MSFNELAKLLKKNGFTILRGKASVSILQVKLCTKMAKYIFDTIVRNSD